MIALYLLASHLAGDFLLQNRWQAAEKIHDRRLRREHCLWYGVAFVPVCTWLSWGGSRWAWHAQRPWAFLALLMLLHYLTDSRRFQSTLGDVIQWRLDTWRAPLVVKQAWLEYVVESAGHNLRAADVTDEAVRWPTPNPWSATALMVDQTLHVCQLALLGGLLLT